MFLQRGEENLLEHEGPQVEIEDGRTSKVPPVAATTKDSNSLETKLKTLERRPVEESSETLEGGMGEREQHVTVTRERVHGGALRTLRPSKTTDNISWQDSIERY